MPVCLAGMACRRKLAQGHIVTVIRSGDAQETSDSLRLIGVIMDRSSSQRGLHVLSTVFIKFYTIMQIRKTTKAKKNSGHRTPPQEHPMILEVGSLSDSHNNHIPSCTRPRYVLCGGFVRGADFGSSTIQTDLSCGPFQQRSAKRCSAGAEPLKYVQSSADFGRKVHTGCFRRL